MKHITIESGLTTHLLQTRKFKTNVITILLRNNLRKETATKNAVLARLLHTGTKKYKSRLEIERQCEEMFGAFLDIEIVKKGEEQIIQLYLEVLREEFCGGESLMDGAGELLSEIMFNPDAGAGGFDESILELQKNQLKEVIAGKINDKKKYALDSCIEKMCENEPFGVPGDGYLTDLEDESFITPIGMWEHYKRVISECKIEIGVIGDFDEDYIINWAKTNFARNNSNIADISEADIIKKAIKENVVKKSMGLSNAKLVIGARCDFPSRGEEFYKLLLFNTILGGGANSKLFKRIREEYSLCYYVNSFVYRSKAILVIQAGIDENDFEKILELIRVEIEQMQITKEQLRLGKATLKNQFETLKDSPQGVTDFYMSNVLANEDIELSKMGEIIDGFEMRSVAECAGRISFDTVYLLS